MLNHNYIDIQWRGSFSAWKTCTLVFCYKHAVRKYLTVQCVCKPRAGMDDQIVGGESGFSGEDYHSQAGMVNLWI